MMSAMAVACVLLVLQPAPEPVPARSVPGEPPAARDIFPGVRVDLAAKVVEFDGVVPMDCHDPQTPHVYLELLVCGPDSREHESLVMTRAKPSHIHAALLMLGLEPGAPGRFESRDGRAVAIAAAGPEVAVEFEYAGGDGKKVIARPAEWIKSAKDGRGFDGAGGTGVAKTPPVWVFSGSRFVKRPDPATGQHREVYDADGTGVVVGLHTFGSEVVGLRQALSPDSARLEPEWIADTARVPKMGTSVVVRLRSAGDRGPGAVPALPRQTPSPPPATSPQPKRP
ncbi:MAG: YdjY domain-containing protein [Phycisphaerales bacterium]